MTDACDEGGEAPCFAHLIEDEDADRDEHEDGREDGGEDDDEAGS
jgi:hypothetical protein